MDFNKYKEELLNEKDKLNKLIGKMEDNTVFGDTTKHTSEKYSSGELSSYDNHIGDIGTDVFMQDMQNSLITHEEGRLYQVDKALDRIDEGTYGTCEECKSSIEKDRLDIIPETNLCNKCAKEMDNYPDDRRDLDKNLINKKQYFYSEYLTDLTDLNKNNDLED
ncbi:TraR/DksA family transcriptional regulator [Metaclostridioides mangenotii]|uniref:TraR/DksA family transcriptional regulator n=1 Tax=Metaclostridioides mangenotii TaxID=1540 RepID=UPI00046499CA|nr:TraR/DksA C4-type zinc finger protein [Clostridioides mangenotii]